MQGIGLLYKIRKKATHSLFYIYNYSAFFLLTIFGNHAFKISKNVIKSQVTWCNHKTIVHTKLPIS